jgi:dedicator of cytokinesis protein 1
MQVTNKVLRDLIIAHRSDPTLQLNPLSLKISGIVDAAVMGGVTNYEKVSTFFFNIFNIFHALNPHKNRA